MSVSNDLKYDAERDLNDIGASKIEVYPLNKVSEYFFIKFVNLNARIGIRILFF